MPQTSVLLADDNAPVRELIANVLRPHFTVYEPVDNGRHLVDAALLRKPDVIVSDVWMPVLNGLEALRILRQLGSTTPFVMVSADVAVGPQCLAAGATAFVGKTNVDRLVRAVAAAAGVHGGGVAKGA